MSVGQEPPLSAATFRPRSVGPGP